MLLMARSPTALLATFFGKMNGPPASDRSVRPMNCSARDYDLTAARLRVLSDFLIALLFGAKCQRYDTMVC